MYKKNDGRIRKPYRQKYNPKKPNAKLIIILVLCNSLTKKIVLPHSSTEKDVIKTRFILFYKHLTAW
jgi:hypothetical protein